MTGEVSGGKNGGVYCASKGAARDFNFLFFLLEVCRVKVRTVVRSGGGGGYPRVSFFAQISI